MQRGDVTLSCFFFRLALLGLSDRDTMGSGEDEHAEDYDGDRPESAPSPEPVKASEGKCEDQDNRAKCLPLAGTSRRTPSRSPARNADRSYPNGGASPRGNAKRAKSKPDAHIPLIGLSAFSVEFDRAPVIARKRLRAAHLPSGCNRAALR